MFSRKVPSYIPNNIHAELACLESTEIRISDDESSWDSGAKDNGPAPMPEAKSFCRSQSRSRGSKIMGSAETIDTISNSPARNGKNRTSSERRKIYAKDVSLSLESAGVNLRHGTVIPHKSLIGCWPLSYYWTSNRASNGNCTLSTWGIQEAWGRGEFAEARWNQCVVGSVHTDEYFGTLFSSWFRLKYGDGADHTHTIGMLYSRPSTRLVEKYIWN